MPDNIMFHIIHPVYPELRCRASQGVVEVEAKAQKTEEAEKANREEGTLVESEIHAREHVPLYTENIRRLDKGLSRT